MIDFIPSKINQISGKMELLEASYKYAKLSGIVAEFGVYHGHSINEMSKYVSEPTIYGFDSFEGLPERWRDGYEAGHFATSKDDIWFDPKVKIYAGWFNETVPVFKNDVPGIIKFLSIDCDIYSSAKYVLDSFKDTIVPGTVIFFDEFYNYPGWKNHEYKAFVEFVQENDVDFDYLYINPDHEQVSVIIQGIK